MEGRRVEAYLGIVFGEAIVGANPLASLRDAEEARRLGADTGVDYEVLGQGNSMLTVTASGTAVKLAP